MQFLSPLTVALTLHLLGSAILIGSLLYVQLVSLPAIAQLRGGKRRFQLRVRVLARTYTGLWAGAVLLLLNILFLSSGSGFKKIPDVVVATYNLFPILLLLLFLGQEVFLSEIKYEIESQRIKLARRWYLRLRATLLLTSLVATIILFAPFVSRYIKLIYSLIFGSFTSLMLMPG